MNPPGMTGITGYQIPLWLAALLCAMGLSVAYLLFRLVRHRLGHGGELAIPPQIPLGHEGSLVGGPIFGGWECRLKVCSVVLFMFSLASVSSLAASLAGFALALLAALSANVRPDRIMVRISAIALFLMMLLLILPLSTRPEPGDLLIYVENFRFPIFNLRGFQHGLVIMIKAAGIVLLMEPLFYSAPLSELSRALIGLRFPEKAVNILNLSIRYLSVVAAEASSMILALKARAFRPSLGIEGLATIANLLAMLFIRSFERTARLEEAMRLRGYRGGFPPVELRSPALADYARAVLFLAASIGLIGMDRIS